MRTALEDVCAQESDRPCRYEREQEVGIDVEASADGEDAPVEKHHAEFDEPDGEDADDQDDLHVLIIVSLVAINANLE